MRAHSLLRRYMVDIRSRYAEPAVFGCAAAYTRAGSGDGREIGAEGGMP